MIARFFNKNARFLLFPDVLVVFSTFFPYNMKESSFCGTNASLNKYGAYVMNNSSRLLTSRLLITSVFLFGLSFSSDVSNAKDLTISTPESTLRLSSDGYSQLFRADGTALASQTKAVKLRYAGGTELSSVRIEPTSPSSFDVFFEDGTCARYEYEVGVGSVLFRLVAVDAKEPISEFCLLNVAVPDDLPTSYWTNTTTFSDGFRAGVTTTSVNALPVSRSGARAQGDAEKCAHTFRRARAKDSTDNAPNYIAEFRAVSNRAESDGWSFRGKNLSRSLDLSNCKRLRARVYGDGKGEALKIQLGGAVGHRDDYIAIDFKGWKIYELDAPELNDLSYDDVQRLYFYYNGLPGDETVCCYIDYVEAIFDDGVGGERSVLLEDFNASDLPYFDEAEKILTVQTFARHKIFPASCGLITTSKENWSKTVRDLQNIAGVPSPLPGNGWRGASPYRSQSYFFLTNFKADEYEKALRLIKRGDFKQMLLGQESWCESTGHYNVAQDRFPGGYPSLRDAFERFNKEGIRCGLHLLGASVDNNDAYITPTPDKRFVTDVSSTLAEALDGESESVALIKTSDDGTRFPFGQDEYMGSGKIVRIDDELIYYEKSEKEGLLSCERGVYGSKIAAHNVGAKIEHFTRAYGYHLPDLDTDFIDEIATNFASLANRLPIDMVYFDGSELLQRPGDEADHWYYNARLHKAFYDKLTNKNLFVQASSCSPYSWHLISRSASADGHNDLKAYLEERSGGFDPHHSDEFYLDVGWYYAYDRNATPDMYEYCLGATLGYDASFSFQTSVDAAYKHPFIWEVLDVIRAYEDLRLSGRFPKELRAKFQINEKLAGTKSVAERDALLALRKEYRLERDEAGRESFRRVVYPKWQNVGSATSDQGGATNSDARRDGDAFVWNLQVDAPSRVGFQAHFKTEGEVPVDAQVVDPSVSFWRVDGEKEEFVATLKASCRLLSGQYVFKLPDASQTLYGLPLEEGAASGEKTPDVNLDPGVYRVKFEVKAGADLPIRVRTPLYTDEIYVIP